MSFFDLPPIIERMLLVSDKISDLNFSVGQLPQVEINGKLTPVQPLGLQKLSPYQTEIIAMTLLQDNSEAAERLVRTGTADASYSLPSRARFRCNIFQQRGVYSIEHRLIPLNRFNNGRAGATDDFGRIIKVQKHSPNFVPSWILIAN